MDFDFSSLGLKCGEEWVPFPVIDDMDLKYWAQHTASEVAARFTENGEPANERALEKDLRHWAADTRSREPLAAFGWYVNGYSAAAAIMEIDGIVPDEANPELTLQLLTDWMTVRDLGEPEVREVQLPLGPASRVRQNFEGAKRHLWGARPVVRNLIYAVRPAGTDVALTMYISWRDPVIDEPLTETADKIAKSLEL